MTDGAARDRELSEGEGLAAQWVGLLLAPATFFAHLQIAYVLVPRVCAHGGEVWIHVAGVASVVLAAVGALVAWRVWERAGRGAPGDGGGPAPRARFLAVIGVAESALFVLLLLAQWLAAFFISPCQ
ncbi:MAG: hypothetical protein ACJ79S_03355 [Gemmatimonadaceae bacterium]